MSVARQFANCPTMNPIRRELLNGLFVLVLSTLLSAAIAAFQLKFNLQVWVLIVMAVAIAVGGYVEFKFLLSTEERETEWLKRVGTPARLELGMTEGSAGIADRGREGHEARQRSYCDALR